MAPAAPKAAATAAQAGMLPPTGERLPTPLAGPPTPPAAPPPVPAAPRPAVVPAPAPAPLAPPAPISFADGGSPPTSGGRADRQSLTADSWGPPTVIVLSFTQRICAPSGAPGFGSQASPMPSPTPGSPFSFGSLSLWSGLAMRGQLSPLVGKPSLSWSVGWLPVASLGVGSQVLGMPSPVSSPATVSVSSGAGLVSE